MAETTIAAVMTDPASRERGAPSCDIREIPQPDLERGSALLRVEASEVCGTDVHLRDGRLAGVPYPIIPGHVSAGVLQKVRGEYLDIEGNPLTEGDRVTFLDVHKTCHRCWHCLVAKASTRCPYRKVYGITYGIEDGLTGGWAQHIELKPGTIAVRLDGVSTELFMAGGCSLPTALHAVERADIALGDSVLILGSGPVGLSALAFSLMRGARRALLIGAPPARLEVARAMGAEDVLDFQSTPLAERIEWVRSRTGGRGADVVIECTGAPAAVSESLHFARDAGRVVVVGQYTDHGETSINPHLDLNKKHIDIRGCWGSDYSHFHRVVDLLRTDIAKRMWSSVPLARFDLAGVDAAMDSVRSGKAVKAIVTPDVP